MCTMLTQHTQLYFWRLSDTIDDCPIRVYLYNEISNYAYADSMGKIRTYVASKRAGMAIEIRPVYHSEHFKCRKSTYSYTSGNSTNV